MILGGITHPVDKNETVISSQKMYVLKTLTAIKFTVKGRYDH